MHKTTIKIDGAKLKALLEKAANKSIYEIALENGFSKNIISNAVRSGYASSTVKNIAKLYGIAPAEYQVLEFNNTKPEQISIDDIETDKKNELKSIFKEAIIEIMLDYNFEIFKDPYTLKTTVSLIEKRR